MGRFSPTVTPVPNNGLANALGNFTESYMQFAARRRQKDLDAVETGIGLTPNGPPPQTAPSGPIAALRARLTGRTNPNDIAGAMQNAAPAVQSANAVNSGVADALSRGETYKPDPNAPSEMPKYMRLPSGQVVATAMTPLGQRLAQQRLAAMGMGSEIALRNSEVAKNQREASTPRLGDKNFAAATAEVEGAKAQATLGPELQKLVAQGAISRETALMVQRAQAGSAAALQGNQQTFTAGENTKNRSAEAERQTAAKGEELSNKIAEIGATQQNQLGPNAVKFTKKLFTFGAPDVPGVTRPLGSAAPKQQITAAEAAQLKALGHTDQDIQTNYVITGSGSSW